MNTDPDVFHSLNLDYFDRIHYTLFSLQLMNDVECYITIAWNTVDEHSSLLVPVASYEENKV